MAHNKFLPRVLAAAAAMMLLAGCSSKADPGFSPANPVNITIWTYYNGEQLEAFNALVDKFNSTVGKEQGITVESSSHGSVTDLETNVLASAEGKVGAEAMPNIFSAYADTAYALDEMGQIADLSDYLSEEDRAAFIEDYLSEGDFSGSGSIKIFPSPSRRSCCFSMKRTGSRSPPPQAQPMTTWPRSKASSPSPNATTSGPTRRRPTSRTMDARSSAATRWRTTCSSAPSSLAARSSTHRTAA